MAALSHTRRRRQIRVDVKPDRAGEVPGLLRGAAGSVVEVPAHIDDAHLVPVGCKPIGGD